VEGPFTELQGLGLRRDPPYISALSGRSHNKMKNLPPFPKKTKNYADSDSHLFENTFVPT
jgi:hypothetical protein